MAETARPILPSRDFDATAAFLARFGFVPEGRWPDYLILRHPEGAELHFFPAAPGFDPASSAHGTWIDCADPAALTRAAEAAGPLPRAGIPRLVPPEEKPWGLFEGHWVDPDGTLYRFGRAL